MGKLVLRSRVAVHTDTSPGGFDRTPDHLLCVHPAPLTRIITRAAAAAAAAAAQPQHLRWYCAENG